MTCVQELSLLGPKCDLPLSLPILRQEQESIDLAGGLRGLWNMICVESGMKGLDAVRVLLGCP